MTASTVLIVDDSAVDLENLKRIVSQGGYKVITASDGADACQKAKSHKPDVILMDVVMDGMDGFEACRSITNEPATQAIPVIFVTSKNQKADRIWAELQGGKGVIPKPYTSQQILDTIASV